MQQKKSPHTFHIPVMGLSFTIDSPVKVAHYGISSVISIVDDFLVEKMREYYSKKLNLEFKPITTKHPDYRAERIREYLNLIDKIVRQKFNEMKNSILAKGSELEKYIEMLPSYSELRQKFNEMVEKNFSTTKIQEWLKENISVGSIDVNIMTKLDKPNYNKREKLPVEFNDAHAALRGFAESNLESSIVLSAGINPRLYSYIANFDGFYPDENGYIKKKVVIKVSDFRSALIQGKFLAQKGIWVSEYRIESGLNCGGHAFATDGFLMGPILEEFKNRREELIEQNTQLLKKALLKFRNYELTKPLEVKFTAQGGLGTAEEHEFLLNYYKLDSVGWGSPFLLVPEATVVDDETRELLAKAREKDLYLSGISPLGVPFNSLRTNTKDAEKIKLIKQGKPGSSCPKKFLVSNTEFTDKPICTASRQYQKIKLKELVLKDLPEEEYEKEFHKITDKSCLCLGLASSALVANNLEPESKEEGVSVCPGPNLAYFSQTYTLKEMVDHIYGRINIMLRKDRPNLFIKELKLYVDYLNNKISEVTKPLTEKEINYFVKFSANLQEGINYYKSLFDEIKTAFQDIRDQIYAELDNIEMEIEKINYELIPLKKAVNS